MSRTLRFWVLGVGLAGVATVFMLAFLGIPAFGSSHHPYRDLAVPAAVSHATANVISSVNFDQRAIDTLGEETILFGSVVAVAALLRPEKHEELRPERGARAPLQGTRMFGYVFLPVSLVVGFNLVAHGHLTPGGGFQGGIMLATGIHLLYVAGRYRSLEELRPKLLYEIGEAAGVAGYAALGFAGIGVTGAFLANLLPNGTFGQLLSAGTVPILNGAVGVAVGAGGIVMLVPFFEQLFLISRDDDSGDGESEEGPGEDGDTDPDADDEKARS